MVGREAPVRPFRAAARRRRSKPLAARSLLVVDDMAQLASAVVDALRDAGYVIDCAADGEEALAKVLALSFDLVICDLKMPRLDGKAFYRQLEAAAPALAARVIFVTGDVAGTDAEQFLKESGCRWLAKPFRLRDLLKAVAATLAPPSG